MFKLTQSVTKKSPKIEKSKLATQMAAAAAVGAFVMSEDASAQASLNNFVDPSSIEGFSEAILQPDGSLLIKLINGQGLVVPAGEFVEENGQFLIEQSFIDGLSAGNGPNFTLLGLGAVAVAGIGVALVSGGDDDDDAVPPFVEVEPDATGPTAGDDVLEGTEADDTIDGLAGNDEISGFAGNDTLIGGAGNDTLTGGTGDDALLGGGGTDVINGGDGVDTNSFEDIGLGVEASINNGTATYGMVSETFTNIENLTGTDFDDRLGGDAGDNVLTGLDGNDEIFGAGGNDTLLGGAGDDILRGSTGTDVIDGGDGVDTNSFQDIGVGVEANINNGTATYGGVSETFTNIENLTGTDFDDRLGGDAGDNVLIGLDGNDEFLGGAGNDTIDGGDGFDTFFFQDVAANITVVNNGDGTFTASSALDGTNTLSNIESLVDSTGAVIGLPANVLAGGSSTKTEAIFSSAEFEDSFIPLEAVTSSEEDFGFTSIEDDFGLGPADDLSDVFEIA